MREAEERMIFQNAVDRRLSGLQENPFLAQRIMNAEKGEIKVKKKLTLSMILVIVLLLIAVTALAVALLSPKEIVEQVAVPLAQENDTSEASVRTYTHEELAELIRTLDENGLTLEEDSRIMKAFQNGHGFWEQDVVHAIFETAYGKSRELWTLEEEHCYGEAMVAIGVWDINPFLIPGENDLTAEEASAFASQTLKEKYGITLPLKTDDQWVVVMKYMRTFDDQRDQYDSGQAEWQFSYCRKPSGAVSYSVFFDRTTERVEPWAQDYPDMLDHACSIANVRDILEMEYGGLADWPMEAWADFGNRISDMEPKTQNEWLFQHAGYRYPPENAITVETAIQKARSSVSRTDAPQSMILCCTREEKPIYKVLLKYPKASADVSYDAVWCLELDCETGVVLEQKQYEYSRDKVLMQYVPFGLLNNVPEFEAEQKENQIRQDYYGEKTKAEEYMEIYGHTIAFWPPEKQVEVYPSRLSIPSKEQYELVTTTAMDAIKEKYGPDALTKLGDYQIGVEFQLVSYQGKEEYYEDIYAEVYFTTDPKYLSDGFRVHCSFFFGELNEVEVYLANEGNG